MMSRCYNEKNAEYKNYGGRGIVVCERWHDFLMFSEDMSPKPPGKSIDRYPDNDGPYEKENCKWSTDKEQSNNRRTTVLLAIRGETRPLTEWAKQSGINRQTLLKKNRDGVPDHEILDKRYRPRGRHVKKS